MTSVRIKTILDLLALPASDFINEAYLLLTGRPAAADVKLASLSALRLGRGRTRMLREIHAGTHATHYRRELQAIGNDAEFLESLYRRYLGRQIDPSGLQHYSGQLARKDRAMVEVDIANSAEARIAPTLWGEVHRLVAQYHKDRHWWLWHQRQDRAHRLQDEVVLQILQKNRAVYESAPRQQAGDGRAGESQSGAIVSDPAIEGRNEMHMRPRAIETVEPCGLGANARQVLQRLRATQSRSMARV